MAAMTERLNQVERTIGVIAHAQSVLLDNQKELAGSANKLDEQFAVSTRMSIIGINALAMKQKDIGLITEEDLEQLFLDWAAFRGRSDFRDLMTEWMLGVPLGKLPPPPVETEGEADAQGDHGDESPQQELTEDSSVREEDDVPKVQPEDGAEDRSE